jgi:sterol desaturase/sphingolipid hydroxylase (fatty acid hydroxylase superfamily)
MPSSTAGQKMDRKIKMNFSDNFIRLAMVTSFLLIGLFWEKRSPLRKSTQPKKRRVLINLSIAIISAIALRLTFFPLVLAISEYTEKNKWGFLFHLPLHPVLKSLMAIILLDYTLYFWHIMLHKIPFLWRFHNAHHIDLDLDTSTALRFHFGELMLSTFFRSAQILIFGITPFYLILFETLVTLFAEFHHSNILLPEKFENFLNKFLVGPRMHGIHHSIIREETDSNFGAIFTFWDKIHHTIKLHISQVIITIGHPAYQSAREQTLVGVLFLPFRKQREWKYSNGKIPFR